jgi:hypothetical protein
MVAAPGYVFESGSQSGVNNGGRHDTVPNAAQRFAQFVGYNKSSAPPPAHNQNDVMLISRRRQIRPVQSCGGRIGISGTCIY